MPTALSDPGDDRRHHLPAWAVFGIPYAIAAVLVFALPWFYPPKELIAGPSYELGFNNLLAMLGLVVAIAVGTVLAAVRAASRSALEWLHQDVTLLPRFEQARGEYTILALLGTLLFAVTLLLNEILLIPYWGEASYFLSRIDLVAMGFRPYVDFQYNYGPLLVYLPVWLQRISLGLLGLENAYAVCVAFGYILGLLGQFVLLRALQLPSRYRALVLLCCVVPWTTMSLGLNYVPLRFTAVPCCIVLIHTTLAQKLARASVTAGLACAFCLGLSPEMGMALVLATVAYAGVLAMAKQRTRALVLAAAAVIAPLPYLVLAPKYLSSLGTFLRGNNNFPIYPNLHNVLFVAVCLGIFPPLLVALWRNRDDCRAPLAAALCGAGGWLIGPALGRCDPGHVVINSIIPTGLMFAATAAWGKKRFLLWCGVEAVVGGFLLQLSFWNHYAGTYRSALDRLSLYREQPELVEQWRRQWQESSNLAEPSRRLSWSKVVPYPEDFANFVQGKRVSLPLATPADCGFDRVLKLQRGFRPAYYPIPAPEITSPNDVERVVADALTHDVIVLGANARDAVDGVMDLNAYATMLRASLSELMLFPVATEPTREPFLFEREVQRKLIATCDVVSAGQGALLLKPKSRRNGQ